MRVPHYPSRVELVDKTTSITRPPQTAGGRFWSHPDRTSRNAARSFPKPHTGAALTPPRQQPSPPRTESRRPGRHAPPGGAREPRRVDDWPTTSSTRSTRPTIVGKLTFAD